MIEKLKKRSKEPYYEKDEEIRSAVWLKNENGKVITSPLVTQILD